MTDKTTDNKQSRDPWLSWQPKHTGGTSATPPMTPAFEMVVGDLESSERGSGARANAGKVQWHQLPLFSLEGVLRVLEYGERKYKKGNWAKGMAWSIPYDCMMRHIAAWQRGEELDSESGLPHWDHALTNMIFISAYRTLYPEGDDRVAEFAWPEVCLH